MADLNIPNVNKKTDKYIFKKKLPLRRKSKRTLFTEATFMFFLSFALIYINYLIPNKILLLQSLPLTFSELYSIFIEFGSLLPKILIVVFIFTSMFASLFLILGSIIRIFKIFNRKTKKINYK